MESAAQKIYLVRHGQTDYNLRRIVQGRGIDAPLNETGIAQAGLFYEAYKEVPFAHVYISALQRTRMTAGPFIDAGLPFSAHPEIDEIDWGDQEGKQPHKEMHAFYKRMMDAWASGDYTPSMPEGESPLQVQNRVNVFLESILNPAHQPALIVSHGRTMRIILCTMLGEPLSKMQEFEHGNLGLYVLERTANGFKLLIRNAADHLQTDR